MAGGHPGAAGARHRVADVFAAAPPAVADAAVTAGVITLSVAALALSDELGARPADAGAYALLAAAAAPLWFRRRRPVWTLGAVTAATLASFAFGYPGGPVTLPLLAAIYSAAVAGHRRAAWLAAGMFAGGGSVFRSLAEGEPLVTVALNAALFVLVALLGDAVSSRRALRHEVSERLRRAEVEREREAQRRVVDERLRIARELHDVMAHTIAAVTVQAGVAADTLDRNPDDTRRALRTIRDSARQATTELRATVSVLRDGDTAAPLLPAPGLGDLPALAEATQQEGLRVGLRAPALARPLPAATELTVYRIVQEALTNVVRHARATSATVTVEHHGGELVVAVDDDGHGPGASSAPGFGLQGMRERAEAVGGRFTAGPKTSGGYRVRASLPTGEPGRAGAPGPGESPVGEPHP